ncbi:hypothetical protein HPP92_000813 [Vanilla planifolia]|uniref:Protein kinase domain-containing protein n=1 Tax=Vanilla planifolia TaxID=51239 RepID=A0A835VLA6_VANPL|nr:hypothetical protein HPP92_000813 [Vanilla planifolia]
MNLKLNWFLLLGFLSVFLGSGEVQLTPILINCGANASTSVDGRKWIGDTLHGNNFTISFPGIVVSTLATNVDSVYGDLYTTARVFNATSTYNFSTLSGTFYIRLHFFPFPSEIFDVNNSSFDVRTNNLKLVSKFNVAEEISWKNMRSNSNFSSLMKEYYLDTGLDNLWIEFSPGYGSLAFINVIEVIPVLYKFSHSISRLGNNYLALSSHGIETMYRLNMGGPDLETINDYNLRTKWESDDKYMFSVNTASKVSNKSTVSYTSSNDSANAPLEIYETARVSSDSQVLEKRSNMSWSFNVDPNFDYLVRLHFCEVQYDMANQRIFGIFINNKTAAQSYDVFKHAKGMNKAYHEDFMNSLPQNFDMLWLQLGPDPSSSPAGSDAILNGLEVFKLSRNGYLANVPSRVGNGFPGKKKKVMSFWMIILVCSASLFVFSLVCAVIICLYIRKKRRIEINPNSNSPVWRPFLLGALSSTTNARASKAALNFNELLSNNRMGRMFSLADIKAATNNFDESLVIGVGGFGKVFKGEIEGMLVAIKRAHPQSQQGLKEFETEIEMLSKLRHQHLVAMIGYCDEQNEMILVYEYMAKGTLRSHLLAVTILHSLGSSG